MLEVDGHTCFKFDNSEEILCMTTEDNLNQPTLVSDADASEPQFTNEVAGVQTTGQQPLGATFVPKSSADDGCCGASIPYVPYNIGVLVLCLDIFLPGIGTLVSAYYDPSGCNCKTVTCGIFQLILTPVLIGWIWSIIQGSYTYKKSKQYDETLNA